MAVLRKTVEVYEGNRRLKVLRKRKIMKLPCKIAGAQFDKYIYPLYQYRSGQAAIDILDKGYHEFACEDWSSEQKLRCQDDTDSVAPNWSIVSQEDSRFLFFDGSEKLLRTAADELWKYGLVAPTFNPFEKPDTDNFRNDWFIRLDPDRALNEVEPIVGKVFSENNDAAQSETANSDALLSLLPKQLQEELSRAALEDGSPQAIVLWLSSQLEAARKDVVFERAARSEEVQALRAKAEQLEAKLEAAREDNAAIKLKHETEIEVIQGEKERLINKFDKEAAGAIQTYAIEKQLSSLRSSISDLDQRLEDKDNLAAINEELSAQVESLSLENEGLEARLRELSGTTARFAPGQKLSSALAVEALRQFENLEFHYETPDIILSKFTDPANLFELLRQLESGQDVPSRTVSNARTWREVNKHIRTGNTSGNANMGRIYLKKESDRKLSVVIHHKRNESEQSRLINKLRDANFFRPLKF